MTIIKYIKSVLAAIIFLLAVNTGFSQTYSITPNDSIIGTVPFNDLYHFIIQQNNLSEDNLVFSWQQINVQIPEGWTGYLCDLGFCYGGFPENGTMDSVYVGDYGLLSVGVNPFEIVGTAIIQYTVWEISTPEQIDTLTWIITSGSLSTIKENKNGDFTVFPNPANKNFSLKTNFQEGFDWKITDVLGNQVLRGTSLHSIAEISAEVFPNGIYFITTETKSHGFSTSQLIINH